MCLLFNKSWEYLNPGGPKLKASGKSGPYYKN